VEVLVTGSCDKRVLYGTLSLQGAVELYYAKEWGQDHFQAYLRQIRKRWCGWRIALFLDRGSPHTAGTSRRVARALGIELRWLPTACPELNHVDYLWRHVRARRLYRLLLYLGCWRESRRVATRTPRL
jgi:hypothetical protein